MGSQAAQYAIVALAVLGAVAYLVLKARRAMRKVVTHEAGCGHCEDCPIAALEESEGCASCTHRDEWCPARTAASRPAPPRAR
jgi:hypothetical protein